MADETTAIFPQLTPFSRENKDRKWVSGGISIHPNHVLAAAAIETNPQSEQAQHEQY
jgi:hypothetical protein